jgi:uncharacterized phiE125 gp8 family phage protein
MIKIIDIKQTESSPTEPVTLAQVKSHCKVDGSDDDTLLTSLITQVRRRVENYCAISVVTKTNILTANICGEDWLPYGPIVTIDDVQYREGTNTDGTPDYEELVDDDFSSYGEDHKVFKSTQTGVHKITYTTGYTTVPDDLKLAILNEVAYRYTFRGDQGGFCEAAKSLLMPYKRTFGI